MLLRSLSLIAAVIVTSFLMAMYAFDEPATLPALAGFGLASSGGQQDGSPAPSGECAGGSFASPFASAGAGCKEEPAQVTAIIQNAKDASSIGKALRDLNPCDGKGSSAHCSSAHPAETKLVERLEDMTRTGDAQARFELAMQLNRQEQRSGRGLNNAADVAQDTNLQRAVALVAEAAAAGNADAQRLKETMEDGGRLFHTGR